MRTVLELAGYKNIFGKQRGSPNPLNNARATIEALKGILTAKQVEYYRSTNFHAWWKAHEYPFVSAMNVQVAELREMTLEEVAGAA